MDQQQEREAIGTLVEAWPKGLWPEQIISKPVGSSRSFTDAAFSHHHDQSAAGCGQIVDKNRERHYILGRNSIRSLAFDHQLRV